MLRIYRGNRFLNTLHFESGSTAREIGSIKIHNGQQVLFSDRWFRDIFGSNCSLKHDESIIFDDLDVSIKRKHDFNLQAFAIMDLVEPQSVYRGEKEIALYLHYDLFDFEISYNIKYDGIYKVYNSKKYSQVSFQEQITNYEKALRDYQYNTIYKTIEEISESKYNLKTTEALSKKLIRQLKSYEALKRDMESQKQIDMVVYGLNK